MKSIYLVRHGETNSNLLKTWRTTDEHLTNNGIEQAKLVGERVKHLPVNRIIASTASRTMKTAELIREATGLPVEGDALFYEEKTPTSIQGLVHEKTPDNPIEQYIQALLKHSEDPDYHYENEENLFERRARIAKIVEYLTALDENDRILVVTHGNILKMLVAYIMLGSDCTAKELYLASQRLKTANTGITQLIYENDVWRVLIWNDHAHFAE